jgi:hypothetical protein
MSSDGMGPVLMKERGAKFVASECLASKPDEPFDNENRFSDQQADEWECG